MGRDPGSGWRWTLGYLREKGLGSSGQAEGGDLSPLAGLERAVSSRQDGGEMMVP